MSPEVLVNIAIAVIAIAALIVAGWARGDAKESADAAKRSADAADRSADAAKRSADATEEQVAATSFQCTLAGLAAVRDYLSTMSNRPQDILSDDAKPTYGAFETFFNTCEDVLANPPCDGARDQLKIFISGCDESMLYLFDHQGFFSRCSRLRSLLIPSWERELMDSQKDAGAETK